MCRSLACSSLRKRSFSSYSSPSLLLAPTLSPLLLPLLLLLLMMMTMMMMSLLPEVLLLLLPRWEETQQLRRCHHPREGEEGFASSLVERPNLGRSMRIGDES